MRVMCLLQIGHCSQIIYSDFSSFWQHLGSIWFTLFSFCKLPRGWVLYKFVFYKVSTGLVESAQLKLNKDSRDTVLLHKSPFSSIWSQCRGRVTGQCWSHAWAHSHSHYSHNTSTQAHIHTCTHTRTPSTHTQKKKLFISIEAFGGVMVDTVAAQLRGQGFIPEEPDWAKADWH